MRSTRQRFALRVISHTLGLSGSAMESLEERIRRVTAEPVEVVDYDPGWPAAFDRERQHLLSCLPSDLVVRIEHFGSTAVPGLAAKPVIDVLVEVTDLATVREHVVLRVLLAAHFRGRWRAVLRVVHQARPGKR
jgi:GrpB-like predicted nucleotidyltransferase (UPF0157 family)